MPTTRGHDLSTLLIRELQALQREMQLFPDDQSIWRTVPGVTNSAGTLALHVAGNLKHYIGAILGETGYVRNRPEEFARRTATRAEVVAELDAAIDVVQDVLARLPPDRYDRTYPEMVIQDGELTTDRFLMHLCTHAACHLGQAGYLRRVLTGDSRSAEPVALRVLG